ncbi:uncharacterized protein [Parasteatoda tepidariorum]|uniref:uncharacterized protein isoform X1 n=1 Tax=Parasteatoda tepidariorum TaxID=114398 RepID=UPI001C71EB2E|nr:uncharacterized protein LOC107452987 isoform X1 [Parasteatoda tepidariorum]
MATFNSFSQEKNLYHTIYTELKALGVKVPKPKKIKWNASKVDACVSEKSCKIFSVSLREQEWISNGEYPVPKFVALTTEYLQKFTKSEGLFRKGGNVVRQRKLKATIENGGDIQDSEPNDVAALLKMWLRELPEPLIPTHLQELFIRCRSLEEVKDRETAYLFAFLLLPIDHQNTLKHLLRFFANMAVDSDKNKMGTYNLALILAPNIFAMKETADKVRNDMIFQHTEIIQMLIENSDKIGMMPPSSLLYQTSLLGSELTTSTDIIDAGPGRYKKRMSGTVQDLMSGFRRLVGQNVSFKSTSVSDLAETSFPRSASKRKAEPEHTTAKRQKQSISLDDLDSPTYVTPEKKGRTIPEKSSSRHTRRKSFGALFLRKREKKSKKSGSQNLQMTVVDIPFDSIASGQEGTNSAQVGSKCQLNLNFTHSFPIEEKESSIATAEEKQHTAPRSVAPTRSDSITVVKKSETAKWYVEQAAESIRTSSSKESASHEKASNIEIISSHKSGLSRQEAFSIKPPKTRLQNVISDEISEKDSKPDNLNENVKTDSSTKIQKSPCLHSHSSCNLKCCKNKSVCEKKTNQSKIKAESIKKRRAQSMKIPRQNDCSDYEQSPMRVNSYQNLPRNLSPSASPREGVSAANVTQSLDLSLSLLLQNFCLSPPIDAPEFRLSIDISSDKKNSELKVNISQKETPVENQRKKSNGSSENEATDSKPRKRLSSNSDSRIPRLKKIPNPNRPSSFHGNLATSKRKDDKFDLIGKSFGRHSTKIPLLQKEGKPLSTPKGGQDKDQQSPNDSCFKTPDTSFYHDTSTSWVNGSHYLSALTSPDDSIANKRESILKILKYNPGHVLSKVNMFDSKGSSGSESDCKLVRTSSEKYSSVSRCTRPKLIVSNSYNAVSRSDSVRYRQTPHKQERPVPRRVSFKALESPLSKSTLPKCTKAARNGIGSDSSERSKSVIKK